MRLRSPVFPCDVFIAALPPPLPGNLHVPATCIQYTLLPLAFAKLEFSMRFVDCSPPPLRLETYISPPRVFNTLSSPLRLRSQFFPCNLLIAGLPPSLGNLNVSTTFIQYTLFRLALAKPDFSMQFVDCNAHPPFAWKPRFPHNIYSIHHPPPCACEARFFHAIC